MSVPPAVAVCLVTYNSAADLDACLAAISRLEHRPLELSIVDCASSDASAEIAARAELREIGRTLHRSERNLGFAAGMNRALAATAAPYVLVLNPDTLVEPDFVGRLLARLEAAAALRVGAVTARLLRPSSDGERPILDACGMHLTMSWRHLDRGSDLPDRGQWQTPERVFGGTGAATLFVRQALDDVALEGQVFDPDFHTYREDAELCFRLRERGWEVLYEPAARAVHRRANLPRRRRDMPQAVNYHSLKNRYLLRIYHQTAGNLLLTALPTLTRDLAALVYVLLFERPSLGAYGWLWRHRRRLAEKRRRIQARRLRPPREIDRWFWHKALPL